MKGRLKRVLARVMVLVICINTMGIYAMATEISETELLEQETSNVVQSMEVVEEDSEGEVVPGVWNGETKANSFKGEGFEVTFSLVESWDSGFNATIKVQNTSETVIENWCLKYELSNAITNIWNATVLEQEDNTYTIKNDGWNQDIAVGECIEFGFTSNEGFHDFPKEYELIGGCEQANEEDYTVECKWDNDWQTGFQGTVSITNNTEDLIEDWTIEFDFENEITDIWDAEIISFENNHYVIHNAGYNKDIAAGDTISFGIVVNAGDSSKEISNIAVTEYTLKKISDSEPERELEPLDDIGEVYFKQPTEEDVVTNDETGIMYIKNQVLVSALPGAPKEAFEEIAEQMGAEIVGYIQVTNDYQFEFQEDKTAEELDNIIAYLNSFSFVSYASLNLYEATAIETASTGDIAITDDRLYNDGKTYHSTDILKDGEDYWNEVVPDGDNWGLEALRVPSAWKYRDEFKTVRVGVYDHSFSNHNDLVYDDLLNGEFDSKATHGTHVAGILAAQSNNDRGISGVATKTRLYGAVAPVVGSSMTTKSIYANLIYNNVKVINASMGYDLDYQFAASRGDEKVINQITELADVMGEFLNKLIIQGRDFVIVTSAGNTEKHQFVADENAKNGYRDYNAKDDKGITPDYGKVDARYGCTFAAIEEPNVKSRIIVVGAIEHQVERGKTTYKYAPYSNTGMRVDVCAPGTDILSTVYNNWYTLKDGTSMASPYIAGIVAMMYQMNPSISGATIKNIIRDSSYTYVSDLHGELYGLPDASVCIKESREEVQQESDSEEKPAYVLTGRVRNAEGKYVSGVQITARRISTDESNLDASNSSQELASNTVCTDVDGRFDMVLPSGTYNLNVYAEGYLPFVVNNVEVKPDETKNIGDLVLTKWVTGGLFSKSTGIVIDALDGKSISGATVRLKKGWNNCSGAYVCDILGKTRTSTTGADGRFSFELPSGIYTAEVVRDGYIAGYFNIVATTTELASEQTIVLTPILSENEYRIILSWDRKPEDLDSHLTYYVDGEKVMHVYYAHKTGVYEGDTVAELNLDDVSSYGPETVTITLDTNVLENGIFKYSVHNFTGRTSESTTDLSLSGAMVRVYKGNSLINTFSVPLDNEGTVWHVFDIDKEGLTVYNEFYDESSPEEVK